MYEKPKCFIQDFLKREYDTDAIADGDGPINVYYASIPDGPECEVLIDLEHKKVLYRIGQKIKERTFGSLSEMEEKYLSQMTVNRIEGELFAQIVSFGLGEDELECTSKRCAYWNDGFCRFKRVFGSDPVITEDDGCTSGVMGL